MGFVGVFWVHVELRNNTDIFGLIVNMISAGAPSDRNGAGEGLGDRR